MSIWKNRVQGQLPKIKLFFEMINADTLVHIIFITTVWHNRFDKYFAKHIYTEWKQPPLLSEKINTVVFCYPRSKLSQPFLFHCLFSVNYVLTTHDTRRQIITDPDKWVSFLHAYLERNLQIIPGLVHTVQLCALWWHHYIDILSALPTLCVGESSGYSLGNDNKANKT